ncbi:MULTISPECIES: SCO0268 family class II lanthipeptide [unclassified Streptomyces]|uniref:SCO0268 family class II lanthipeptide n=1 Tax=unclassified Streptomyces TaxID=2593676 RepID=UPI00234BAD64|nr:SCO0268 family class II lanthipeptide [Streptomyces sp. M92]WCN05296.1 SCO0268 family class II lanthipeptide [Streptomyces sp. M92]
MRSEIVLSHGAPELELDLDLDLPFSGLPEQAESFGQDSQGLGPPAAAGGCPATARGQPRSLVGAH